MLSIYDVSNHYTLVTVVAQPSHLLTHAHASSSVVQNMRPGYNSNSHQTQAQTSSTATIHIYSLSIRLKLLAMHMIVTLHQLRIYQSNNSNMGNIGTMVNING